MGPREQLQLSIIPVRGSPQACCCVPAQKCVTCTRCSSCGSPNVARWEKVTRKPKPLEVCLPEESRSSYLALCLRCATLRERGNFCPLCNGCYEDDDYEAKVSGLVRASTQHSLLVWRTGI